MRKEELIKKLKKIRGNKDILLDFGIPPNKTFIPEENIEVVDWNSEKIVIRKSPSNQVGE